MNTLVDLADERCCRDRLCRRTREQGQTLPALRLLFSRRSDSSSGRQSHCLAGILLRGCLESPVSCRHCMSLKPYPSDLTDAQWQLIEPLLPAARPGGRPRKHDLRAVVHALFYLNREGCTWRRRPTTSPPWRTVYDSFAAWKADGAWEAVNGPCGASCGWRRAGRTRRPPRASIARRSRPPRRQPPRLRRRQEDHRPQAAHRGGQPGPAAGRAGHDGRGPRRGRGPAGAGAPDRAAFPRLRVVRADSAYGRYGLPGWVARLGHFVLALVQRPVGAVGFVLLPQRGWGADVRLAGPLSAA